MALNDELEKIRQAEQWLTTEPEGSPFYNAARDHLLSLVRWGRNSAVKEAARQAVDRWIARNEK